ncbi:MAG: TMAO reductase system periplasmic protein TorT [Rubrivivax sp.]|nr:TMAO reductase system periplasmic protein TorT [Rubrivivax sp.]
MSILTAITRQGSLALLLGFGATAQAADWFPLKFNSVGADGKATLAEYTPLPKASKDWSICVSFPHMKDPFFLAANYGVVEEAKRLGVRVQTLDAGGYTQLSTQVSQIENCVAGGANAVVMVAIARDGMNNLLAELKKKNIPVVDAVNGVSSKDTGARVLTSPRDEGYRAGAYLAQKHPKGSKPVKVAWLPGPAGAGFVEAFNAGFQDGIKDSAVVVAETKHGDVGKEVQARLVEDLLQTHKDLDYLAGTAVMAEAAVPLLRARKLQDKVRLVSVYMTPGVYQHLKTKSIDAAGSAPVVLTARITIDTAVRLLEKKVEYTDIYTLGQVYTPENIGTLDRSTVLAPDGFKPVFKFGK